MTERLYYTDAYLADFESEVTSCAPANDRFEVTLAATAFYPTGGGQPNDLGELGGRRVLDVVDREGQGVAHIVDGPLDPGATVRGVIDWPRRFDHMQQHSGQHMLSAAFGAVCRARTESFHLGSESSTIDLGRVVSPAEIAAAEEEVNRVVWADREVRVCFAAKDDALALRKESAREGTLRLIEVDGFDRSACGGTHVSRTGAVGIIAVTGSEKFKGGTRVEFLCGGRALRRLRAWRDVFSATSRVLSVMPEGLAPAIERLQAENKSLGRTLRDMQEQLAVHKAAELVAAAERGPDGRIVVARSIEGWDASGLKAIANAAAGSPGVCVAVFSGSAPFLTVIARADDVKIVDALQALKALVARFGGKGGGTAKFAQGGGLEGDIDELVLAARELLGGG
jgi:alanyl-tRNA synthetase